MRNLLLAITAALLFTLRSPGAADGPLFPAPEPADPDQQVTPSISQAPAPQWVAAAMAVMVVALTGERQPRQRMGNGPDTAFRNGALFPPCCYAKHNILTERADTNFTAPDSYLRHCGPPLPLPTA